MLDDAQLLEVAQRYANTPELFTLHCLEVEIAAEGGKQLILYSEGAWSCSCPFFEENGDCSHVRATSLLLDFFLTAKQMST